MPRQPPAGQLKVLRKGEATRQTGVLLRPSGSAWTMAPASKTARYLAPLKSSPEERFMIALLLFRCAA